MDELHVCVLNLALCFFSAFAHALHGNVNIQAYVHEHPLLCSTVMSVHGV